MGRSRWALALIVAAAVLAAPAAAKAQCRLALLLALDVSTSVDAAEDRLQRGGLARALTAPGVVQAILAAPEQPVALSVYEWAGRWQQRTIVPWTLLTDAAAVDAVAARVAGSRRTFREHPTALGYALGHAASLFARAPACDRRTLDVSGDGRNNEGFGPPLAFRNFPLDGVTVNGLAITNEESTLDEYYRAELMRGPGAFVIEARDFHDFERAMREKLIRELGLLRIGLRAAPRTPP